MNDSSAPQEIAIYNQQALEELAWAIEASEGQFSLILARCNYARLRDQMVDRLQQICTVPIQVMTLPPSIQALYTTIRDQVGTELPSALMVFGLESVSDLEQLLSVTNQVREEFRCNFPFPLVLWITDEVNSKLMRLAPDFESWATTTKFTIATDTLLNSLQQGAESLFAQIFSVSELSFRQLATQANELGTLRRLELEAALRDLQSRGIALSPDLQASLEFVQGLDAGDDPTALMHFQNSLHFWQELSTTAECPSSARLKMGLLLHFIGRYHYWAADREKYQSPEWESAKAPLQQCLNVFEQAERPDLVAKCITQLERLLQRLNAWHELAALARWGVSLHQTYGSLIRLASDYSFLAQVAAERQQWAESCQLSRQMLDILNRASEKRVWEQSLGLLLLAQAERHLGKQAEALAHLNEAKALGDLGHPQVYVQILEQLRQLALEHKQYLEAFQLKQERYAVEQQYGIRAFIGAGRLQPKRQEASEIAASERGVAPEIAASGRQQDLERLLERIGRNDYRLVVIHGNSGVGKSSLVNAGLVPALKQKAIGTKRNLPVVMHIYTHWVQELTDPLDEALAHCQIVSGEKNFAQQCSVSAKGLLEQLRQNDRRNLRTVLIFDQFEEFFFVYQQPQQRRPFFEFLADCLQILSVKVILSLREDYLHLLLECSRLANMQNTGIDILSQNVRYGIGNFPPADAKAIFERLTERARFYLEPALIEQLVQDLSGELGEVRPIELQVVGAQLQADKITRLTQYQALGDNPKETLVERYLAEVVADCGKDNQQLAELVLYLLTDEKGTRPLKTRADLEKELQALAANLDQETQSLDLILTIFVKSGLVVLLPEVPADRYQLVHDYLANFIRHQQESRLSELAAALREERRQRQQSEEKLGRVQKRQIQLALATGAFVVLGVLAIVFAFQAKSQRILAEVSQIEALNAYSEALLASNKPFDALMESLKAGKRLQSTPWAGEDLRSRLNTSLQQALYRVREYTRLEGHRDRVNDVSFSPDGKMIASASNDQTVKLWSLDGRLIRTIKVGSEWINGVRFSPDGQTIATASRGGAIKLWSTTGNLLKTLQGRNEWLNGLSFSPNGKTIATAGGDKSIELWSREGKLLKTIVVDTGVSGINFSPDGKTIAGALENGTLQFWNLNGQRLKGWQADRLWMASVSFSPNDKMVASGSGDEKAVKLWSRDGKLLKILEGHSGSVTDVHFSPDGNLIASASDDKTIKLWSREGTLLETLEGHKEWIRNVAFSPNGDLIASASGDKTIRIWNLKGQVAAKALQRHNDETSSVDFSADGKLLATGGWDGKSKIWSAEGKLLHTLRTYTNAVHGVSFDPNGKQIATANADGTVTLWNAASGKQVMKWKGTTQFGKRYIGAGFVSDSNEERKPITIQQVYENSPAQRADLRAGDHVLAVDGKDVLGKSDAEFANLVRGPAGTQVTLRISRQGRSDFDLTITRGEVNPPAAMYSASFSLDGKLIASVGEDKTARLWNLKGQLLKSFKGHTKEVLRVAFSPDGKTLATASEDKTVKLWSIDGNILYTLKGHTDGVFDLGFSPDGRTLATASKDRTIRLWSIDGKLLKVLEGHTEFVRSVAFSSDGKTIASGGFDKTVKLWSLDGNLLKTLYGQSSPVVNVHFSPDSNTITSISSQNTLMRWNLAQLSFDKLMVQGCNWVSDYLKNSPNLSETDRHLCDGIGTQK